jgi:outer membrane receptor protein involved in Fe transport
MTLLMILAQAAAASVPLSIPAEAAAPAQPAVASYPASFFAALNSSTAYEMVGRIPGFTLDTGASVRGYEGAAGNVLFDGQRASSKSDSVDEILKRMPASAVERIDVIRGGAPGIDMQGKTVLANVIRKKSAGLKGLIAPSYAYVVNDGRSAPGIRVEASGGQDGRAWEVSARGGKGIDDGAGNGAEIKVDPKGKVLGKDAITAKGGGQQWIGAGSYEMPLAGGQVRINGRYFANNYKLRETDDFAIPQGQQNRDRFEDREDDTEVGARYSRALGVRSNVEVVGLRTTKDETISDDYTQRPGPHDLFVLDRYSTETIGRAVLKFRQTPKVSWEAGGEVADNTLDSKTHISEDGAPIALNAANVQVEEKRWEGFVKSIWQLTETLSVESAVREEGSKITSQGDVKLSKSLTYTKPRVAITWAPNAAWQVRLRVEREVGQLDFDDFVAKSSFNTSTVTSGNPNLNPQQAWVAEAAVERRFWGAGSIVITARHYKITDAVDRAPIFLPDGSFTDAPANIGNGTKDEIAAELTLPLDKLGLKGAQLKGNVTQRWSEVTDPTTHTKREFSNLRPIEWEAHFAQPLPRWNVDWGIDFPNNMWRQTFYRADVIEDQKLKIYVDPFINWKPRPDIQLRLEIQNLGARGFRDTRNVYAGARNKSPLAFVDDRDQQFGQIIYFRVRKYFGG